MRFSYVCGSATDELRYGETFLGTVKSMVRPRRGVKAKACKGRVRGRPGRPRNFTPEAGLAIPGVSRLEFLQCLDHLVVVPVHLHPAPDSRQVAILVDQEGGALDPHRLVAVEVLFLPDVVLLRQG